MARIDHRPSTLLKAIHKQLLFDLFLLGRSELGLEGVALLVFAGRPAGEDEQHHGEDDVKLVSQR